MSTEADNAVRSEGNDPQSTFNEPCSHAVLVSIYFSPETTGIAPYSTSYAEFLTRQVSNVTVITGMPHFPAWSIDPSWKSCWRSSRRSGRMVIERLRHYVPSHQSVLSRALYEVSFLPSALIRTKIRPCFVVGVTPTLSGAVAAAAIARRHRAPLGIIVQDLVGQAAAQSGIRRGSHVSRIAELTESLVLKRAKAIAVVSESFIPWLVRAGIESRRILMLPNWTHISDAMNSFETAAIRERLGWPPNVTVVLHAGNMGSKQALDNVIEAAIMAQSQEVPLLFVLMGEGNQRTLLMERAAGVRCLQFLPPQDNQIFPSVLAAADILLVNERSTVHDMCLPSKLTSYFASGRPIIAATSASSATAAEIHKSRAGIVIAPEDPRALTSTSLRLRNDHVLASTIGRNGQQYAGHVLSVARARSRFAEFTNILRSPR